MIIYNEQQEENSQLRAQLTRSMTSLISTGKVTTDHIYTYAYKKHTNTNTHTHTSLRYTIKNQVSVSSCSPGEVVLVLWSDEHTNYQVCVVVA